MRGEFMVQKSVGIAWEMNVPGTAAVDAFLKDRWRMSDVTEFLRPMSKAIRDETAQGLLLGENPRKIALRYRNVENMNKVRAERIARTTVTAVSNQAQLSSYERFGVKMYEFSATFDERTCPVCGALDGRTYPISEASQGTNYPPIHPNCRCTTMSYMSEERRDELFKEFVVYGKDGSVRTIDGTLNYEQYMERYGP